MRGSLSAPQRPLAILSGIVTAYQRVAAALQQLLALVGDRHLRRRGSEAFES